MVKLEGLTKNEIKERKLIKMTRDFLESKGISSKLIFEDSIDEYGDIPRVEELGFGWVGQRLSKDLPKIGESSFYIILKERAIHVNSFTNRIVTGSQILFNDVVALAQAYEEAGLGEFTIKKQYEE